jgi:branched-chain amino acid transport system permease protein
MRLPNTRLTTDYVQDTFLFRSWTKRVGLVLLVLAWLIGPFVVSEYWATVLVYAGIASVGAMGLNLLTGFTGQASLGHAAFYGVGAYAGAAAADAGLPFPLWLVIAAAAGGFVGGLAGPFALRLRGNYLVIVSLGLLVLGQHVFENWASVTGGLTGRSVRLPVAIGSFDAGALTLFGTRLTRSQGYLYFVWAVVAVLGLAARNITRTRPGRALQAIRDRDLAAEIIGVSQLHYKVGAFVVSSAYAACAGAIYASYARFLSPLDFSLFLSIQFVAMIVVGGIGTIHGSILGALFLTLLPRFVESVSDQLPFVSADGAGAGLTVQSLNQALFGVFIIAFLLFEPLGLAEIWRRLTRYFKSWPFSY